jgi:hypothetical protein
VIRLVALLALLSGCWLTKPPPISPTAPDGGFADASAGQTFVDCSEAALHAGALGILPAVETALALGDYEVELAKLVGAVGLAEVECAVSWVVAIAEQQRAQTADSLEVTKVSHGRAWQAAHPVTFAAVGR